MMSFPPFKPSVLLSVAAVCLTLGCEDRTPIENRKQGSQVADSVNSEKLEAGKPFLNFKLPDVQGKTVTLNDFRGKVVLVNFWATWCNPCTSEMPALERLYQTLKGEGLEIAAITVDVPANKSRVEDFVKETGLSFPVLLDDKMELPPDLGITGFPESFFVGPDGQLLTFSDPEERRTLVRVISDRPWDSPVYIQAIRNLIAQNRAGAAQVVAANAVSGQTTLNQ